MNRKVLVAIVVTLALSAAASAGTISGKVSGVPTESVVYVEAIAGQNFSSSHRTRPDGSEGALISADILVVQQGTTVEFLNSDTVAHNVAGVRSAATRRLAHNMGTWPKGEKRSFKFDNAGAVPLLCNVHPEMEATSLSRRLRISHIPTNREATKSKMSPMEATP